jgi:hypothetical protein
MRCYVGLLAMWLLASMAWGMMNKRALASMDHIDPSKRFRADIIDLAMGDQVSSTRVRRLAENAGLAGAAHTEDLAKAGKQGQLPGNISRDLLRKAMKKQMAKILYLLCQVRQCENQKTNEIQDAHAPAP